MVAPNLTKRGCSTEFGVSHEPPITKFWFDTFSVVDPARNVLREKSFYVTLAVTTTSGVQTSQTQFVRVKDILIVAIGDSMAAGEGNPDRPIALSDEGFCFRRFLGGVRSEYFRPGRAGYRGNRTCGAGAGGTDSDWAVHRARWMSAACHRSLYGYQVRTALALAVQNPHIAVTFIPLACTGAQIMKGVLDPQIASEVICERGSCPRSVPAQINQLREILALARRQQPDR